MVSRGEKVCELLKLSSMDNKDQNIWIRKKSKSLSLQRLL